MSLISSVAESRTLKVCFNGSKRTPLRLTGQEGHFLIYRSVARGCCTPPCFVIMETVSSAWGQEQGPSGLGSAGRSVVNLTFVTKE